MSNPLAERDDNAQRPLRKVRFEAAQSSGEVESKLLQQVEQLKHDFGEKVQTHLSTVAKLEVEYKQRIESLEAEIMSARQSNSPQNSENRFAPAREDGVAVPSAELASTVPYENSDWAAMVAEYGAQISSPVSHGSSVGTSDVSSDGLASTPERSPALRPSEPLDRSPAVEWTVAGETPLAPAARGFGSLPARVNCIEDQQDRCLPQAPLHDPPRGPVRAVSANLPEVGPMGGVLSRTCSRTLLSVDGPRSARESRPTLAVPSGPSSARSDVTRTRLAVETRPAVGGLSSPRRLGRLQPGPVVTSRWGAPVRNAAPRASAASFPAAPAAVPAARPALQAPGRQPARQPALQPTLRPQCAVLRR